MSWSSYPQQTQAWSAPSVQSVRGESSLPATPAGGISWQFGVEIELCLKPDTDLMRKAYPGVAIHDFSWAQVASVLQREMAYMLEVFGKEVTIGPDPLRYKAWSITHDPTISTAGLPGYYGFEIISPILSSNLEYFDHLKNEIHTVWESIAFISQLYPSKSCGTHIHISPGTGPWDLQSLASLSKCIVYFDPLIDALVPDNRRGLFWSMSNIFSDGILADLSTRAQDGYRRAFHTIDTIANRHTIGHLVRHMSPTRFFAWNFKNLEGHCGTAEFRRPPVSETYADVLKWISFVLAFATASAASQPVLEYMAQKKVHPDLSELQYFLQGGGPEVLAMFDGKSYHPQMTRPFNPARATVGELEIRRKKEKKKSLLQEKMKQAQRRD